LEPGTTLPVGVGLSYRPFVHHQVLDNAGDLDFVEVAAAHYVDPTQQRLFDRDGVRLTEICRVLRCTVSSDTLSIGSVEPIGMSGVERISELLRRVGAVGFTEQLAFNRLGQISLGSPQPMPCCEAAARWVACRYRVLAPLTDVPFMLAVTEFRAGETASDWTEVDFINHIADYTDCGISLDVTGLFVSARNGHFDPMQLLRQLPASRIAQLRICGVCQESGRWRLDPQRSVADDVFDLLDAALEYTHADTIVVTRDGGYFPFADVLADVRRAQRIFTVRRGHIPERGHFAEGKLVADIVDSSTALSETDEALSAVQDYQSMLIERCRSADVTADPPASEMADRAAHAAYLRDYLRQQQLVHWALRDAGIRPGR
jgi:uncharacterized protein